MLISTARTIADVDVLWMTYKFPKQQGAPLYLDCATQKIVETKRSHQQEQCHQRYRQDAFLEELSQVECTTTVTSVRAERVVNVGA
jgi:hypothetical protein